MITIQQARTELENLRPFNAGNLSAFYSESYYCVFSYSQVIARVKLENGEQWVNPSRYSVTTSKHQNIVRRAWGLI